jgi:plasmid stabilization system protein ParE
VPAIVWTRRAIHDLLRLRLFLAHNNPDAARRAIEAIRGGIAMLEAHPQIGRPAPDLPRTFRDWFIRFGRNGYIVRYRLEGTTVVILRVRHGREAGF